MFSTAPKRKKTKKKEIKKSKVKRKQRKRKKLAAEGNKQKEVEEAIEKLNSSLLQRSQIFEQISTNRKSNNQTTPSQLMNDRTPNKLDLLSNEEAPPAPSTQSTLLKMSSKLSPIGIRVEAATVAAKKTKRSTKSINAAAINAAKAKVASRLSANASEARRKKTQKRGEGQNSTDQNRFHYLGGSLNLRAERERRKELEERLVATQSAVQRSTEEMQPAIDVLIQSVSVLEQTAKEQHKLDLETGKALEGLQSSVSLIKNEYATKLEDMKKTYDERLGVLEQHFREERARDKIAYTKLARSHQSELALLRSKFLAFQESTKKRLDSLPSAISKIRAESHSLVESLSTRLTVVSEAVGQLDQAVFDVDREQLRIKLAMRNDDPATGSPVRSGFMNDSLDQSTGYHPTSSDNHSNDSNSLARESVVRRMQKELRELVNEVARDRSTMRQRHDEQSKKISDLGSLLASQSTTQQRANSELHELVARITSVMRGDLGDQLKLIRENLNATIDEKIQQFDRKFEFNILANDNSKKYSEIINQIQQTASTAAVDADEALRYAREAMAKIGSVDAGLAARVVQARQVASERTSGVESSLENLTRRIDGLSSEIANSRRLSHQESLGIDM